MDLDRPLIPSEASALVAAATKVTLAKRWTCASGPPSAEQFADRLRDGPRALHP